MFIIASSGRCATRALSEGLDRFSDHEVRHEPSPRLLEEAFLKHRGAEYRTPRLIRRLRFFARRTDRCYGESFRGATLLSDIAAVAPSARFLVLVRPPLQYVLSAHARRVLERGDEWDRTRLMPRDSSPDAPLAERLAWHWVEINRILLDFVEASGAFARVGLVQRVEEQIADWARFVDAEISDQAALASFLRTRPNRTPRHVEPPGWDERRLARISAATWERAAALAERACAR